MLTCPDFNFFELFQVFLVLFIYFVIHPHLEGVVVVGGFMVDQTEFTIVSHIFGYN